MPAPHHKPTDAQLAAFEWLRMVALVGEPDSRAHAAVAMRGWSDVTRRLRELEATAGVLELTNRLRGDVHSK